MIDKKKLDIVKKIIKLECTLHLFDEKKITKSIIEQKVQHHIDNEFKNDVNRRKLFENMRDEMFEIFLTGKGNIVGLSNNADHEKWYDRKLIENKPYWEIYREYLVENGKMPIESINDLDKFTDVVISDIERPDREGNWDRRGLVVGSVQSGKTSNYLGLISKARDAGYKFIVILSGANNDLRKQTQKRVDRGYIGLNTFALFNDSAKDPNQVGLSRQEKFGDNHQFPYSGTIDLITGDFNKKMAQSMNRINIKKEGLESYVFVIKKNKTPLSNLIEWISILPQCKANASGFEKFPEKNRVDPPFITDFPILVIDDECDHYSIDTGKAPIENGKVLEENNTTTINALIRKLLQCFSRRAYIGYTATPFANILIHDDKTHKKYGEDIFPKSFIYDITPPPNHKGLETIFGEKEEEEDGIYSENINSFLIPINDFCEKPTDLFCKTGWFPPKHKPNHVPFYDDKTHPVDNNLNEETLTFYLKLLEISKNKNKEINLPPSLIHAIISFILACTVRNQRSILDVSEGKSMLIHVTKFVEPQKILTEHVGNLLQIMSECLKEEDENKKIFHDAFRSIYDTYFLKNTNEYKKKIGTVITYDKILYDDYGLKFTIGEISRNIFRMSGKGGDAPDYEQYLKENKVGLQTIVIGGDKLSRGVTFEGLSTTYFLRSSKMMDTLMQMGRWFGYRSGYDDLCRLYTSADLLDSFVEISLGSQKVRSEIRAMNRLEKTPKDFGLWIQTSPYSHLIPTARNKMRYAKKSYVNYSLWGNQMPTLPWDKDTVIKNFNLTSDFIKKLKEPNETDIKRDFGINKVKEKNKIIEKEVRISASPSYYWTDVNHKLVTDFLDSFYAYETSKFQPQEMSGYIKKAVSQENMLTNWSVALIGNGLSGVELKLGERNVKLAFRKPKNTCTEEKAALGVIWDPNHEAIDLNKKNYQTANKEAFSENSLDPDTEYQFTKLLRKKRSNKNGLLLIYPILPIDFKSVPRINEHKDPNEDFKKSWDQFKKNFSSLKNEKNIKDLLTSRKSLISLAISFPETSENLVTSAIVNSVYDRLRKEEDGEDD